jgi:hypothetical protein
VVQVVVVGMDAVAHQEQLGKVIAVALLQVSSVRVVAVVVKMLLVLLPHLQALVVPAVQVQP